MYLTCVGVFVKPAFFEVFESGLDRFEWLGSLSPRGGEVWYDQLFMSAAKPKIRCRLDKNSNISRFKMELYDAWMYVSLKPGRWTHHNFVSLCLHLGNGLDVLLLEYSSILTSPTPYTLRTRTQGILMLVIFNNIQVYKITVILYFTRTIILYLSFFFQYGTE